MHFVGPDAGSDPYEGILVKLATADEKGVRLTFSANHSIRKHLLPVRGAERTEVPL